MIFFQKQRIAIVVVYFASKSHCRVINIFQQKYPGGTAPNASKITYLVQLFRDTGSVADRKQLVIASIVKTKTADVDTALQRSPMKRPSVNINIVTEFISLLNSDEHLGGSKTGQRITHHGTVWKF
ncbi:DUF4817 domain-containing protein [Trichonephila clavipes]|nr:DUF4817 domain-containing protein [Trichonephila clavipes]